MHVRRTVTLGTVVAVVILLLGSAAYLLLPPRKTHDVAVPPASASPEDVVAAYLEALGAHDCGTAQSLVTDAARTDVMDWCDGLSHLTDVTVRHHIRENPAWSGQNASVQVANVPVQFSLHWRPFRDEGTIEAGVTRWGYLLMRRSPDEPWRIFDQGTP